MTVNLLEHGKNGNLKAEKSFKNGKLHGIYTQYNEYGKIIYQAKYENGKLVKRLDM